MRHMRSGISFVALSIVAALFVGVMLGAPPGARAQATISTGSVQGAIVDPKGAVVVSARVTITNKDTGQKLESEVTSAGTYNSGPLDRKSTRLNSSHRTISYAVFCLKKKKQATRQQHGV